MSDGYGAAARLIAAASALALMAGGVFLFLRLGHTTVGTVAATAVVYTGAIMVFAFGGGRRQRTYNPLDPRAVAVAPAVLVVHVLFVGMVLGAQCAMFSLKPKLPPEWFTPTGWRGQTRYQETLLGIAILPAIIETTVARKALARSFGVEWTD